MRNCCRLVSAFAFLIVSLIFLFAGCGGGGEDGDTNIGWIEISSCSITHDVDGFPYAFLNGTAFINDSRSAHQCVGTCCLLCEYDDSYPGVDVSWINETNNLEGKASSRYGTSTEWDHFWSAAVPLAIGINSIVVNANDDGAGNYDEISIEIEYLPPAH